MIPVGTDVALPNDEENFMVIYKIKLDTFSARLSTGKTHELG
ncbi:hypothetical protein QUY_2507 [Clostridioides difficile P71]|nr:hypothetical protein HMPREF1122_03707 [Clostridioides difficile 002-P50-2011]EHJ27811.1 hypothetical protein HMPREF1123_02283 [Clostridioides difficile 050-P50-2011]EQG18652.1 hypothetical protein QIG_2483 [Clostridioides difficile DA00065]EQK21729.1 hypothetical protein QUY_2507 [Clostridioides difficile P71]